MFISTIHDNSGHIGPGYYKPTKGALSCLPSSCLPYAELMRLKKPVGTLNIYFPYLFGSLFAACAQHPFVTPLSVLSANLKLFAMAFLLRSAGCTWNDLIDRDLDRKVARCRLRPIARYAASPRSGFILYAIRILVWLAMLLQTEARTVYCALGGVFFGTLISICEAVHRLSSSRAWLHPFLGYTRWMRTYPYMKPFQSHKTCV